MSDVSLSSVLSFLDTDDAATVVERVRAARGERTKRSDRDGRTFLFSAPGDESQPTEVVWIDVEAAFDARSVETFAERCADRGIDGTLLTTGDEEQAIETLALAFAADDQLDEPDEDGDRALLVDPDEVERPIDLVALPDLVDALEDADLDEDVIDEYHEPHEPEFEEILDEIDAEEARAAAEADEAENAGSGRALALLVAAVVVVAVVAALVLFGPF
ncbi:hypothetical protein [Haloferax volcanii]|uniref:hypothetical protein n=1 Tax=Haloferax volcanii TaxID=2246 RepID=UPI0023DA1D5A|nr:hypothetical protein [Haloferax lucentense]WEL25687.1 Uncharacterized protein SVXHx_1376 [Haloferax lucentense]